MRETRTMWVQKDGVGSPSAKGFVVCDTDYDPYWQKSMLEYRSRFYQNEEGGFVRTVHFGHVRPNPSFSLESARKRQRWGLMGVRSVTGQNQKEGRGT